MKPIALIPILSSGNNTQQKGLLFLIHVRRLRHHPDRLREDRPAGCRMMELDPALLRRDRQALGRLHR
jgi:hypothetical protein